MSLDQARHLRIVDPGVNDDFVGKRMAAIKDLAIRHRKQGALSSQLNLADAIVRAFGGSPLVDPVRAQIMGAIRKAAPSFIDEGDVELDLAVVAMLSVAAAVETISDASDQQMTFLASAVALGLTFRGPVSDPKLETLRIEMVALARSRSARSSAASRNRKPIPNTLDQSNYLAAGAAMVENAKLDREEINLLWWAINDWSVLTDERISAAPPSLAALISGIETAGLLAETAARAHRDMALRNLIDLDGVRSARQLADESIALRPSARLALASALASIERNPTIFPALAIATLADLSLEAPLPAGIAETVEMRLVDWCRRVVDEASLLRLMKQSIDLSQQFR